MPKICMPNVGASEALIGDFMAAGFMPRGSSSLFGADLINWHRWDPTVYVIEGHLLDDVDFGDIKDVYNRNPQDLDALYGVGRWLFFFKNWEEMDEDELEFVVERIAEANLRHPKHLNRMMTMSVLRKIGSEKARELLRAVLNGEITPQDGTRRGHLRTTWRLEPGTHGPHGGQEGVRPGLRRTAPGAHGGISRAWLLYLS